jgi:heme exporter protein D
MTSTPHLDFIAAAYAAAVIVVGALIAWVTLDHGAQTRKIAELEKQGVSRRSAATPARPPQHAAAGARAQERTQEQAKEETKHSTKEQA